MAITTDCAEGRHEVCRGAGPNHYCPQTAHLGDQKCACRCHADRAPEYLGGEGIASEGRLGNPSNVKADAPSPSEPDRAPGEVETLLTIGERLHRLGGFQRTPRGEFWVSRDDVARLVDEALDAARSGQAQARDDTVTVAEALRVMVDLYRHPDGSLIVEAGASEADDALIQAENALARFGAGRAESEEDGCSS